MGKHKRFENKYPGQVYDSANEMHVSKASKIRAHGETVANIPTGRGNICTIGCGHEYLMYGERFRFTVMKMEAKRTKLTSHDGTTIRVRRFELTIKRSEMEKAVDLKNIWKVRRPRRRKFLPIKFLNNIEFEVTLTVLGPHTVENVLEGAPNDQDVISKQSTLKRTATLASLPSNSRKSCLS